jgi:hypothetical protein
MPDSPFVQLKQIRKKHAQQMKKIAATMKRAAEEAIELDETMKRQAIAITRDHSSLASFTPLGPISAQGDEPHPTPDFKDVRDLAHQVLGMVQVAETGTIIVVPRAEQAEYARTKYGVQILPADWNPATHYHCEDLRPLTPPVLPRRKLSEYETPEGGWIIEQEEEDYMSDTGETAIIVPKEQQPAFARKRYGIKDLSVVPPKWNPLTHYRDGDFRPITPTHDAGEEGETKYETEDGSWVVPVNGE